MNCQIPEHFLPVTKVSTLNILEDGTAITALATRSKQLLELVDGKVTDCCDLERDADDISVFTSYDPLQKYYLLRCQNYLVVVKRKPLCAFKEYKDIIEMKIQDRLRIGRPQVVIWTRNAKEPIVTDMVGQLKEPLPQEVPLLTATLTQKRQEMNERVANVRRLMLEKRSARYKSVFRLTPHICPPVTETERAQVLAWGPPLPAAGPPPQPPLQLSRHWQKIHNGKWIVGIPVYNTTNSAVREVSLRLSQTQDSVSPRHHLQYDCHVIAVEGRSTSGAEWVEPRRGGVVVRTVAEIAGNARAVVVGVLEEPLFKMSLAVTLTGAIIYKRNDESDENVTQDVLNSEITLTVEDLINGSLSPFTQQMARESDLISVIVTSCHCQLQASSRHLMPPALSTSLETLGLVQVTHLGCWVGSSVGALRGLMIIETDRGTSGTDHSLSVYSRDVKQVALLASSLKAQWKLSVKEGRASLQDCIACLRAEFSKLRSIAKPGAEYPPEEWEELRVKLSSLELATDLSFESSVP